MNPNPETSKAGRRRKGQSAYFLKPARGGAVTVYRRPAGNRAEPKDCGTMPTRAAAVALVAQLQRAESVVKDLFLEATDDGIEALEAVLEACRNAVVQRSQAGRRGRRQRRRGDERRGGERRGERDDRTAQAPAPDNAPGDRSTPGTGGHDGPYAAGG
jgi:hypothetical protein